MRIAGEDDAALECAGALNDGLDDCLRLGGAERPVDEVVLHVDDDEVGVGHGGAPLLELNWGTSEMPAACHYMRRFGILAMTCCIWKWCEHG